MLALATGSYDFVFVLPERYEQLVRAGSFESDDAKPDLVVYDEAHCIVDGGFRDAYVATPELRCAAAQAVPRRVC